MSANLVIRIKQRLARLFYLLAESSWVLFGFFMVAALVFGVMTRYVPTLNEFFESTFGQLLAGGLIYILVVMVVILPILVMRNKKYVSQILGVSVKPTRDIWWLPLVMWLVYMAATVLVASVVDFLPWIDPNQEQDVGFQGISTPIEYLLAFFALVILPPVAEELLFRGYLFGRLRKRFGFWLTTIVVSIVFGLVHFQWNVGVDVAVLSVFLCYLRERTGSIWASMVLHSIKNGLAYFLIFIAPLLGWQLVQ